MMRFAPARVLLAATASVALAGCVHVDANRMVVDPMRGEAPFPPALHDAMCIERVTDAFPPGRDWFGWQDRWAANLRAGMLSALQRSLAVRGLLAQDAPCRYRISADIGSIASSPTLIMGLPPDQSPVMTMIAVVSYLVTDAADRTLLWRPITTICLRKSVPPGYCGPIPSDNGGDVRLHANIAEFLDELRHVQP